MTFVHIVGTWDLVAAFLLLAILLGTAMIVSKLIDMYNRRK